jgi:hypothetical protein
MAVDDIFADRLSTALHDAVKPFGSKPCPILLLFLCCGQKSYGKSKISRDLVHFDRRQDALDSLQVFQSAFC